MKIMVIIMGDKLTNEFPWLIFKLNDGQFTVNSKHIVSIIQLTDEVTVVPHEHDFVKGLITFRGAPIKLIDTRTLLGIHSTFEEYEEFKSMLDQRKQDHINWVNELIRCANENDTFKLATDPHKCAFGKWYDTFESDVVSINFHMSKIEEPHRLLHETALQVMQCQRQCETCERDECLKITLEKAKDVYMPEILDLLEEAKHVFHDHFKEMIVVVEFEGFHFGIIVDEVLSVEELVFLSTKDHETAVLKTQFVSEIAKTQKASDLILLLDLAEILHVSE